MSHFECRLNRRFWRSKKVVQAFQIHTSREGALGQILCPAISVSAKMAGLI